jgi:hypothetical protein
VCQSSRVIDAANQSLRRRLRESIVVINTIFAASQDFRLMALLGFGLWHLIREGSPTGERVHVLLRRRDNLSGIGPL